VFSSEHPSWSRDWFLWGRLYQLRISSLCQKFYAIIWHSSRSCDSKSYSSLIKIMLATTSIWVPFTSWYFGSAYGRHFDRVNLSYWNLIAPWINTFECFFSEIEEFASSSLELRGNMSESWIFSQFWLVNDVETTKKIKFHIITEMFKFRITFCQHYDRLSNNQVNQDFQNILQCGISDDFLDSEIRYLNISSIHWEILELKE
jgi:hypothetical protein